MNSEARRKLGAGVIPLDQLLVSLLFAQQREIRDRPLRIKDHGFEQAHIVFRQSLDGAFFKQVYVVTQGAAKLLAKLSHIECDLKARCGFARSKRRESDSRQITFSQRRVLKREQNLE